MDYPEKGDMVIDTMILGDLLSVYFGKGISFDAAVEPTGFIDRSFCKRLNQIVWDIENEGMSRNGLIVASIFAFIELMRQFEKISSKNFTVQQLHDFMEVPPEWFVIEPMSIDVCLWLKEIPEQVKRDDGSRENIEHADAIHLATAYARGEGTILVTSDHKLNLIIEKT